MPDAGEPKIIIDTDWKAQAQKEKERLAAKERETAAAKAAPIKATGPGVPPGTATPAPTSGPGVPPGTRTDVGIDDTAADPGELPPADFASLMDTIVMQALLYLGGFPDPQTGRAVVSLEHAKFHIDLLSVLEDKTKGNLTTDEQSHLTQAVSELRLRFVEISRALVQMQAKQAMEGRMGTPGIAGPGGLMGGAGTPNLNLRGN